MSSSAPLPASIAWRFLRGRSSRLLSGTARAALVATVLGVMAMVIVMALMSGYRQDLRRKLVRGNAAVIAYPILGSIEGTTDSAVADLRQLAGVTSVRRVVYGQGSLIPEGGGEGLEVTLRGVDSMTDLEGLGAVSLQRELAGGPTLHRQQGLLLVLGEQLGDRLGVAPGEALRVMVLGLQNDRPRFHYRQGTVLGSFNTGFSEFDRSWVVTDRTELEAMLGAEVSADLIEIAISDPDDADAVSAAARAVLGEQYIVTNWKELNRELFTALEVQKIALFFVMGLIVVVSTFNVASSLVVLVRERMRDLGLLGSLGVAPRQMRTIFLLYGVGLGAIGCLGGAIAGSLISWVLTEFELIRFEPELAEIYFISSVPFRVELVDLAAVVSFTLFVTLIACWLPARRAARILPARALRYE